MDDASPEKVLILQRMIPSYRAAVFRRLTQSARYDVRVVYGDDSPHFKARNADDVSGIKATKLPSRVFSIAGRVLTWHVGLLTELRHEKPQHIICEAESHFLGYLTAIIFRTFFARSTNLYLWCFYALPGIEQERSWFHAAVKKMTRRQFQGFVSYSTYGSEFLQTRGVDEGNISVAVNDCDTQKFLDAAASIDCTKDEAKKRLGYGDAFVVSYIGSLTVAKKPEVMLELAEHFVGEKMLFPIVGGGPCEASLRSKAQSRGLDQIVLTGRVSDELPLHYRAADILVIPGRGGIVVSEAMCFGVPVLVHQGDGTEYDLIVAGQTGRILASSETEAFAREIDRLRQNPNQVNKMGEAAKAMIVGKFNTEQMAESVLNVLHIGQRGQA